MDENCILKIIHSTLAVGAVVKVLESYLFLSSTHTRSMIFPMSIELNIKHI